MHIQIDNNSPIASKPRPAFVLVGKVDGVSYQLDMSSEDAREWKEAKVVVEMKTRVGHVYNPPPIYEQIQLVCYMVMLGCTHGDLVQYVPTHNQNDNYGRKSNNNDHNENNNSSSGSNKGNSNSSNSSTDHACRSGNSEYEVKNGTNDDNNNTNSNNGSGNDCDANISNGNDSNSSRSVIANDTSTTDTTTSSPISQLHIHRVHFHGPPYYHSYHWDCTILPRLHVFRDAVLLVRRDDDLRYALLLASEDEQLALIHQLCPYFS
jgi:hypothetical protein